MSIGDLMAALLLIFVLLLSNALLRIQESAEEFPSLQDSLRADFNSKFGTDKLRRWNAVIDTSTLAISFREPDIYFRAGQAEVQPRFKSILNEFFPDYVEVITRKRYRSSIIEVRIEGHTSSEWEYDVIDTATAYFNNLRLSQDRTRSVLEYAMTTLSDSLRDTRDWVRKYSAAIGLSSSKAMIVDGREDAIASRRVEFKVILDAESRIEEWANRRKQL